MDTANHMGLPLMLPLSRLSPSLAPSLSLLNIHSTSTQISIHSPGAGSITDRGESRVRKDEERQSVSDCPGPWAFVTLAPEKGDRFKQKKAVKNQSEGRKRVQHSWRSNLSESRSWQDNRCQWHPRVRRGWVGGVHYVKITLMPFCHRASLLSNQTRTWSDHMAAGAHCDSFKSFIRVGTRNPDYTGPPVMGGKY